jgi:hypothetical protein
MPGTSLEQAQRTPGNLCIMRRYPDGHARETLPSLISASPSNERQAAAAAEMLAPCLHARCRHRPDAMLQIDPLSACPPRRQYHPILARRFHSFICWTALRQDRSFPSHPSASQLVQTRSVRLPNRCAQLAKGSPLSLSGQSSFVSHNEASFRAYGLSSGGSGLAGAVSGDRNECLYGFPQLHG